MSLLPMIIRASNDDNAPIQVQVGDKAMTFDCPFDQMMRALTEYDDGATVQEAFHFLTPDEREFMMTGMTPDEWDAMFRE